MTRQACASTAIALSLLGVTNVPQAQQPALESFYVGRFFFSDDISSWNDQVLEVSPAGDGVRVRLIRLSLANPQCDGVLVQAAERVVPRTTPRKLAGVDVCALDSTGVESALERAAAHGQITEAASTTVVATCAGQPRVLRFPADRRSTGNRSNVRIRRLPRPPNCSTRSAIVCSAGTSRSILRPPAAWKPWERRWFQSFCRGSSIWRSIPP